MNKSFFALALATSFCVSLAPQTSAQDAAPLATTAPKLKLPIEAKETKVPASAKSLAPRGAKTIFAFRAILEGRPVTLHGWRRASGDITLDILAAGAARSGRTRRTPKMVRLNRVVLGQMQSGEDNPQVGIGVARFSRTRGSVLVLEWPYFNVSGSYSYVPLLLVTLPTGARGRAFVQEFQGEVESGGGTVYQGRIAANGNFVLWKKDYASDAGTANYTPYVWKNTKYVEGERGPIVNETH